MQRMLIGGLAVLGAAAMIVFFSFFKIYKMPTASMVPTLPLGSRIVMGRFTGDILRGDLVVFEYPLAKETTFVKRVVGLPCDTVEIRDKQLFVNGVRANEPYVVHDDPQTYPALLSLPEPYRSRDQYGPVTVPAGSYFVRGDNRARSSDSRYWGTVPRTMVRARVVFVAAAAGARRPPRPPVLASLPACRSISLAPLATPATTPAR